jgi:hypothetical protein
MLKLIYFAYFHSIVSSSGVITSKNSIDGEKRIKYLKENHKVHSLCGKY